MRNRSAVRQPGMPPINLMDSALCDLSGKLGFLRAWHAALAIILVSAAFLSAQVKPAATMPGMSVALGGEVSTFNPDWGCSNDAPILCWNHQLLGLGALIDVNHVVGHFGAEGEARWLRWRGPGEGTVQSNYLLGPRYHLYEKRRFSLYAKILAGGSWMTFPKNVARSSYFTLAPGATVEYRFTAKLSARGDYEYQFWPSFSGLPGLGNQGLSPNGFSFGVSYRLLEGRPN